MAKKAFMDRRNKTEEMILSFLAEYVEDPLIKCTPYQIEKNTKLAHSTVDIWLHGENNLVERGLVQIASKEKWRTGLMRSEYSLTFKGLLGYLSASLQGTKRSEWVEEMRKKKKAIKNHASFHPVFKHWDTLEKSVKFKPNVGGGLFGVLYSASNLTYYYPLGELMDLPTEFAVFLKTYPLLALGYEGLFGFHFLGFLSGLMSNGDVEVSEGVPELYESLESEVKVFVGVVSGMKDFVESLK